MEGFTPPFSNADYYKFVIRSKDRIDQANTPTGLFTVRFPGAIPQDVQELWCKLETLSMPLITGTTPKWIEIRFPLLNLPTTIGSSSFAIIPYSAAGYMRMYLPQPWTKVGANNLNTLTVQIVDEAGAQLNPQEWLMVLQVAIKEPSFVTNKNPHVK